jgi:hypothetical protein
MKLSFPATSFLAVVGTGSCVKGLLMADVTPNRSMMVRRTMQTQSLTKFKLSELYSSVSYGRGAEIWPECNEDPVSLSDSFPNGQLPYRAILSIEEGDMAEVHGRVEESVERVHPTRSKRKLVSKAVQRILRRAAAKEELDSEDVNAPMDRTPLVIATLLLMRRLVTASDVLLVSFLTGYFIILGMIARSTREASNAPILPALPPQGHVPALVSNPLGFSFTYSKLYDSWLKLGMATGLLAPLVLLSWYIYHDSNIEALRWCARPIFLLCCQAGSEAFSRRVMSPLPLRILIPIAYNSIRILYLWNWFTAPASAAIDIAGRILSGINFFYWSANLFGFLLPIAAVRYTRAHFFGVEAEEVTTRFGMEETIGLIPPQ